MAEINWKNDFNNIYLVSLDRRPDRRHRALEQLNIVGIVPEVFPAIDGVKLGLKDNNRQHTGGMIGCFLSHYLIFREAYYKNYSRILVFEDDLKLMNGFASFLNTAFSYLPTDSDFVYLGWYHYPGKDNAHTAINKWWIKPNAIWGTQCYAVTSRRGIEVIWQGLQEFKNQVDVQLNRIILPDSGLNYYAVLPSAVSQVKTDSDVQPKNTGKL